MSAEPKTYFNGTHRTRVLDETWNLLQDRLDRYGITRVADVTGLDSVGIPVAMAVRPLGQTLSVSQGKGQSRDAARISAAMEAFEFWHAENACPPATITGVSGAELRLPYRVEQLVDPAAGLVGSRTPLDWVIGRGLSTGAEIPVPRAFIDMSNDLDTAPWRPAGLLATTNGLASGNSFSEATLHALYELIERDALSCDGEFPRLPVDLSGIDDAAVTGLLSTAAAAEVTVEVAAITNRLRVPCFSAAIWSSDFPVWSVGAGAHSSAAVALSRAVTEAAQSRLTCIAGSRDDIEDIYAAFPEQAGNAPESRGGVPYGRIAAQWTTRDFTDAGEELAWLVDSIVATVGCEPIVVELTTDPLLPVVRVVAPGLRFDPRMTMRVATHDEG
jgi:ribosomal protein S12 methylthiotransferase accessory factor